MNIQEVTPSMVRRVYLGRRGKCACGCSGRYYFASAHREEAQKARGYEVGDDEINDAMVTRVLRLVQAESSAFAEDGERLVAEVQKMMLIVELTNAARDALLSKEEEEDFLRVTIEDIRAITWRGNFYRDRSGFDLVHEFVVDESNPLNQRIEALQIASRDGMGEEEIVDEAYLINYLREAK